MGVKKRNVSSVYAIPGKGDGVKWAAVFVVPRKNCDYFALDLDQLSVDEVEPVFGKESAFFMVTTELEIDEFTATSKKLVGSCREILRDSLFGPCELFSPARFSIVYPKTAKSLFGLYKKIRFRVLV